MPKFQFKTAKLIILIKQTISRPTDVTFFLVKLQKLIFVEQIISRPAGFTNALVNAKFKFVKVKKNHLNLDITVAPLYNRLPI
jgi:hypothetical protein